MPGFPCQDARLPTAAIVGFEFIPISLASRSEAAGRSPTTAEASFVTGIAMLVDGGYTSQ